MNIVWTNKARKDMESLLPEISDSIHVKISQLEKYPNVTGIKKLKGENDIFRIRHGQYRIKFKIKSDEIEIERVLHRKDVYK